MAAERRMYLPLAAVLAALVVAAYRFIQAKAQPKIATGERASESGVPLSTILIGTILLALIYSIASAKRLRDYYSPILLWEQVVRAQPANYLAHYNLGLLYNEVGREPESFAELEAAVAAKPDYVNARSAFAFALMNAERLSDAVEMLKSALAIAPNHPPVLNNLGIAYTRLGHHAEAITYLQHALREAPDYAQAHFNLGKAYAGSGQPAQALTEFQKAHSIDPNDPDTLYELATVLVQTGKPEDAIGHYDNALEKKPPLVRKSTDFADVLAKNNQGDLAAKVVHRAIALANKIDDFETAEKLATWLSKHETRSSPTD
jgi:tetratricopeptide (TPR) repeat protein